MALIKKYEKFGVVFSYWKVCSCNINVAFEEASFTLNLYKSKNDTECIHTYCVDIMMGAEDKTLYNEYFAKDIGVKYKDWRTACYELAKAHVPFFADAVDDPDETNKISK